jgi:hypothetical protein
MDASQVQPDINPLAFFNLDELPWFVDPVRLNFFAVQETGNQAMDQAIGEQIAIEAASYAQRHKSAAVLMFALSSIIERGHIGNVEAGFIKRLASVAMVGSLN